jgi:hypothetical protein
VRPWTAARPYHLSSACLCPDPQQGISSNKLARSLFLGAVKPVLTPSWFSAHWGSGTPASRSGTGPHAQVRGEPRLSSLPVSTSAAPCAHPNARVAADSSTHAFKGSTSRRARAYATYHAPPLWPAARLGARRSVICGDRGGTHGLPLTCRH